MTNAISFSSNTLSDNISMSNGLTAVFIDVISLSGSQFAQTVDEKRLIVWLSEKDQSKVGIGTVGFNICDMPWNPQTFESDREFIPNVIKQAKNKNRWNYLQYKPKEDLIFTGLGQFRRLILQMTVDKIKPAVAWDH